MSLASVQSDFHANVNSVMSLGPWDKETDSVAFFTDMLKRSGLFNIYSEIKGRLSQPRPFCEVKDVRIDLILSPTTRLVKAGWLGGPIGVECKKSNVKLNDAFAQADDYTRSLFMLPNGFVFACQYFFLWPFPKTHGFEASQAAQTRIGTVWHEESSFAGLTLKFFCGESKALTYSFERDEVKVGNLQFGFKTGSR